jgi:hypothetical protein
VYRAIRASAQQADLGHGASPLVSARLATAERVVSMVLRLKARSGEAQFQDSSVPRIVRRGRAWRRGARQLGVLLGTFVTVSAPLSSGQTQHWSGVSVTNLKG